jgi:hypothetical protein
MRSPCAHGVSKEETRDKDRRLDEKGQHGIRPVIVPAISSSPRCDDIMILNAKTPPLAEPLMRQSCRRNGQRKFPSVIMRDSHFGKNSKPAVFAESSRAPRRCGIESGSGVEEHEPEHAKDQDRKAGGDGEKRENRRPRLGLARFGRGFNDLTLLPRCHGGLDFLDGAPDPFSGARGSNA